MNTSLKMKLIGLLILTLALASVNADAQSGGPFTLNWSTPDGGGGSCSGGLTPAGGTKFAMTGTVGQPDVGTGIAGTYTLQGGFIPAFALPVTPTLGVSRSGNQFTFTWPNFCTGFVLEVSPGVTGQNWFSLGSGTVSGANRQVIFFSGASPLFFRLRKDCPN